MSASSSDRSDAGAPPAETSPATRTATRPYIEGMIESLRQAGDRPVLRWDGADTTGSQLLAAIYRYARALESLGIARGDLVAMYAPNRPEALAVRYATHLLGAASVYLSAPPASGKRAQMLVDFRPGLVVVFPETAHLLPPTTVPVRATSPWWSPPAVRPACRRAASATSAPIPGWSPYPAQQRVTSWPTASSPT
jgi:acyl-CoA synthetase (AMP-forming)/AMP-acid ligase II